LGRTAGNYFALAEGAAALPSGGPSVANRSAALGVERLLSLALRFLPIFTCFRTRRFQVIRVFEAIARLSYHSRVADTTPSMAPRLWITVLSWSSWPPATWKVFTARPSSVVRHLAWEMFTPCSVNAFEMAASKPGRSVQVTWTATGRTVFDSSSHETSRR